MTFALDSKTKKVHHVSEVSNGTACNCTCPVCGEALIAKQGPVVAHHFAHKDDSGCTGGAETALHRAAKFLLLTEKLIASPRLVVAAVAYDSFGNKHEASQVLSEKKLSLDTVAEEVRLPGVIPDVVGSVEGKTLLIELAVTHFVADTKLRKLQDLGYAAIEVDLSVLAVNWDWVTLRTAITEDAANKRWLFNPKEDQLKSVAQADADAKAAAANRRYAKEPQQPKESVRHDSSELAALRRIRAQLREFWAPKNLDEIRKTMEESGPLDTAWQSAAQDMHVNWATPPECINIWLPGELGFLVDRRVWQAFIFSYAIYSSPRHTLDPHYIRRVVFNRFPPRKDWLEAATHWRFLTADEQNSIPSGTRAINGYLKELESRGFIKRNGGSYNILLRSFPSKLA